MEAKELRIGNWVYEDNRLVKIHDGFAIDHAHNFNPIPLTEEILLKCGIERAEEYGRHSFWVNKDWKIYYCAFNKGARFIDRGWIADMPYLHQLQNLFYSLCGKELEVKL